MFGSDSKKKYLWLLIILIVIVGLALADSIYLKPSEKEPTPAVEENGVVDSTPPQEELAPGAGEDAATNSGPVSAVAIIYSGGRYTPNQVNISVGQTVTWINEDQIFWPATDLHPTHAIYPESNIIKCNQPEEREIIFDACEPMPSRSEYSFTFNEPGEWPFHDHINPAAKGTVTVTP